MLVLYFVVELTKWQQQGKNALWEEKIKKTWKQDW